MALFCSKRASPLSLVLYSYKKPTIFRMHTKCSTSDLLHLLSSKQWMLPNPSAQIHKISLSNNTNKLSYSNDPNPTLSSSNSSESFYIVRDDLIHPLVNGNKARKLDAIIPILQQNSVTDVVTCGGCQSAHAAALGVACAERGMRPHLLLRGEQPQIPTGYNLVSLMYGNVKYVARSAYERRDEFLSEYANVVAGTRGSVIHLDDIHLALDSGGSRFTKRVSVVNEGAGHAIALLGLIRLVAYLSQDHVFGREQELNVIVDTGTGTTSIGLALGALCLGLPWKITAVMLADTIEKYKEKERCLISDFMRIHQLKDSEKTIAKADEGIVQWKERAHPRKFGKVLKGEIEQCRDIAQQTSRSFGSYLQFGCLGAGHSFSFSSPEGFQGGNAAYRRYSWFVWISTTIH